MNQNKIDDRDVLVRKKGKFFLIKNSNAAENYQNHSYFSTSKQQKQVEKDIRQQLKNTRLDRQFVDGSASFGVDNTYKYLWNKSDIKERLKAQWKARVQTQQTRYQNSTNFQGAASFQRQPKNNFRISVAKQNSRAYDSNRRRIKTQAMTNKSPSLLPSLDEMDKQSISFPIFLIFASNIKTFEQIATRTIQLNLSHYLIRLFLKCRINWKSLEYIDFYQIVRIIKIARQNSRKIDFSAKDLVNMRNVSEIFNYMSSYKEGSNEWLGTVRYFFLPNERVSDFLFEQFKDQVKMLTTSKLNLEFYDKEMHFYDFQTGVQLNSMFDFLSCTRIVYDSSNTGYEILKTIIKQHKQHRMFGERIKRWKSIVPLDRETENQKISIKGDEKNRTFLTLDQGSYNKLYERYKVKHAKFLGKPKKQRSIRSQWVQRQKLIKNPDIFQ